MSDIARLLLYIRCLHYNEMLTCSMYDVMLICKPHLMSPGLRHLQHTKRRICSIESIAEILNQTYFAFCLLVVGRNPTKCKDIKIFSVNYGSNLYQQRTIFAKPQDLNDVHSSTLSCWYMETDDFKTPLILIT